MSQIAIFKYKSYLIKSKNKIGVGRLDVTLLKFDMKWSEWDVKHNEGKFSEFHWC